MTGIGLRQMPDMATESATRWLKRLADLDIRTELFIDGSFVPAQSGEHFLSTSPREGAALAQISAAGDVDVDRAVRSGARAFEAGVWAGADPGHRRAVLLRFAELIEANREELALLESIDVGKPISDTLKVDVPLTARTIRWYAEAADKTYDQIAPAPRSALALVTREPLGVVGAVVPWNYALLISSWKIGPALAMGNSVVLKPSEESSLSALLLAQLGSEAGLPDGVLNVVPGLGPVAGAALGRHPLVAKVAFTGSPQVGRQFLSYAAQSNAKQVTLELGGKSPQVVLADVTDLARAASAIAWGIAYNAGQTCNAGSVLIAEASVREEIVARTVEVLASLSVGDPLDEATEIGPLANEKQRDRVGGYLQLAAREGAHFATGGQVGNDHLFVAPAVVENLPPGSRVVREEVFGPVLSVLSATDTADAVRLANAGAFGLAASVWTSDLVTAHTVARALRAGTVWVNTFDASDVITPFGGFKDSGSGRDKSLHALDAYSNWKTTWIDLTEPHAQEPS